MSNGKTAKLFTFLLLLFCGTICSAMIVPYMGFFLVQGLGYDPWMISVYSVLAVCLTLLANRQFAQRIDAGARVFPLVGVAAIGFMVATLSLSIAPTIWTVLTLGVIGFGISSSAVSTMFSLGGNLAERHDIERNRFNAYMRATTSAAWMIGPAVTFLIADQIGINAVFNTALIISLFWIGLWWWVLPRDITAKAKPKSDFPEPTKAATNGLLLAASFVFCLSLAHSLTFSSLPLFYVQEVGLPGFAPGVAFSMKTFVEVFAIFLTPAIIVKFGMHSSLLATTLLAVVTIQILASVQSFAEDRPARATAIYWNTLKVSGLMAGPATGFIAQAYDFRTVIQVASVVALFAAVVLMGSRRATSVF